MMEISGAVQGDAVRIARLQERQELCALPFIYPMAQRRPKTRKIENLRRKPPDKLILRRDAVINVKHTDVSQEHSPGYAVNAIAFCKASSNKSTERSTSSLVI